MSKWKFPRGARTTAALFACALAAAACAEHADTPLAPATPAAPALSAKQAEVNELTRMVAVALNDPQLRQRVFDDLRASRFSREHKLEFRAYLRGQGAGGLLLDRLAAEKTTRTPGAQLTDMRQAVLSTASSIPPLEMYMPVPEHRAAWTGGPDLIVASQIVKDADPVGYRLDGTEVQLSNDTPPATPVLVLVTQENPFTRPMPAQYANADDQHGRALGTLATPGETNIRSRARYADGSVISKPRSMIAADPGCDPSTAITECPVDGGGGGASAPSYPAGVYLDATHMTDLRESWPRGDAEVEVFVIGPTYYPTSQGEIIACAGQNGSGAKYFDQNANDWTHSSWSVEGQLLSKDEVNRYYTIYAAPWSIQMWEDDDTGCEIVYSGRSTLEQLFDNLRAAQRATTLIMSVLSPTGHITIDPGLGNAIRNATGAMFQSDDDFLGNVVYRPNTSRTDYYGDTFVDADVYRENMTYQGWVTIRTSDTDHVH